MPTDWTEARELALAAILPASTPRYVALFDGDPINGGTEISLTGYARVEHSDWSSDSSTPGTTIRSNSTAITFPELTSAGTITHWAIYDDDEGGTLLRSGAVLDELGQEVPLAIAGLSEEPQFAIGELRIQWTDF